ncbi:MAG: DUF5668 domain-containing protein [Cytophagales bacterium]
MAREFKRRHFRTCDPKHEERRRKSLLFWGIILLIFGLVFFLRNLGIISFEIPPHLLSWKLIFVLFSINFLFHKKFIASVLMALLAFAFYAPEILGHEIWEYKKKLWPLIPIFFGAIFLTKFFKKKSRFNLEKSTKINDSDTSFTKDSSNSENSDYLEIEYILSGGNKKINSYNFKGGKISAILSGLEIDLTNCTLENNKATLDINTVMGGVSLFIPREWNVKIDIVPVMGGIDDHIRETPQAYVDPGTELLIKGSLVMGGIEINRV